MEVHETAFVTCAFRSMHEELSGDSYAHLWTDRKTKQLSESYLNAVTPEESAAHSLRNRFYLDTISNLYRNGSVEILINFGCGFSMYPFLLPETLRHIEIDLPHLIDYKKEKIANWQKEGRLPHRDISYIRCDFATDFESELLHTIRSLKGHAPCFILLEGVLFFLDEKGTDTLFSLFHALQGPGDSIGSVSFRKEDTRNTAFSKLLKFMKEVSGAGDMPVQFQTVEDEYYSSLPNYEVTTHQDFFSLAKHYGYRPSSPPDMTINEQFYHLTRVE